MTAQCIAAAARSDRGGIRPRAAVFHHSVVPPRVFAGDSAGRAVYLTPRHHGTHHSRRKNFVSPIPYRSAVLAVSAALLLGGSVQADIVLAPITASACGPFSTSVRCAPEVSGDPDWEGSDDPGVQNPDSSDPVEYTPWEPPPFPPCDNTGDPAVDSDKVEEGFKRLWAKSNAYGNVSERREYAGWIVRTATGYRIHEWNKAGGPNGFCEAVQLADTIPPEGSAAIVGFVHTHPYGKDEPITDCNGKTGPYKGLASEPDQMTSKQIGMDMLQRGVPLRGYILDKDGIRKFEGGSHLDPIGRCGF
jgi:hypothetical protein